MASEIDIETEVSINSNYDTGSNHVVPVMLTFYDSDLKTVKERSRSKLQSVHKFRRKRNIMSFHSNIIIFLVIKEQLPQNLLINCLKMCLFYLSVLSLFLFCCKNVFFQGGGGLTSGTYFFDLLLLFLKNALLSLLFHSKMSFTCKNPDFFLARSSRSDLIN